ncbi:BTAD domain-containing putative transcriptional regulator [Reyranella sp.]|uniref:BTAD domain-containing putative transcriptional regulator n=1 Tax=Reyranella sp. TaxID=1929291 RepID=UPI0025EAC3F6|nr:BTAD domain-containing putative transcriptional regulator [Reyranella sp.]
MKDVLLPKFGLSLLARFELTGPEGPVELPSKKLVGLLAYLACTAPLPQPRQKLATLLWGSHFETQAQQNLRQALFRLRRVLGHNALMSDGAEVWLAPSMIDCDVARLEALSGEGSRSSLAAAADLYQGPLLADVNIVEEAWADWLGTERRRLEALALDAMIKHAGQALYSANAESALRVAYRAVALNALREDAHRVIVQALAATGRKAEALRHYQDLVVLLKRELDTEPDTVTRSLVAGLRTDTGLASEAIDYAVEAGRLAYARWANREAVEFFDRALGTLSSLPENLSTLERAFDIRLELPQVLIQLGEVRRALERLQEAKTLAERLNDERRRCRAFSFMTIVHALFGELDKALLTGTRALEIAQRLGDLKLLVPATTILQQVHFYRGEHERVTILATENLASLPADSLTEDFGLATPPSVYDRGRLIISLAELGRFAQVTELEDQVLRLAAQTQHAYTVGWAHLAASCVHLLRGDWARASPGVEHATSVLRAGNVVPLLPFAISLSAWSLARLGNTSEALGRLQEGEQLLERHAFSGQTGTLGWFYAGLGRAALVLGRLENARRLATRALEFSPHQPGFAAHALHLLGDVATHPDRFDAKSGEAYYRQALTLAESHGMSPVVAHCHLGLGKLYRRKGAHKQANEHLTTATTMYREMSMRFWQEQADAATREPYVIVHIEQVGQPGNAEAAALERYQELDAGPKRQLNRKSDVTTGPLASEFSSTQPSGRSLAVSEIAKSTPPLPAPMLVVEKPSLAVLPFQNLSGDPEQDYFTDGVTEDIVTALSRFHGLVVIARGSSFAFKGKGLTLRQIAELLGAQYVLSGSMRKAGNRIRVSAELTNAGSDVQVWSDRYDRALVDVFDLQDDISRTVAAVVEPAVRDAEIERARCKPPASLSAYDLYLQALPHLWAGTGRDITKAIELLRQSLRLDPTRTPTLAGLAWGLVMAAPLGADAPLGTKIESLDLGRRAVEQDSTDAFAQAVYGFTLFGPVGENDQGRIHCEEAVRLNPSSAFAWGVLGMIGSMGGDYKNAIECLDRSLVLSPYDNMLHFWMTGLTSACFALGRHEEGIAWARKSVQHNPGNGTGHRMLAANLAVAGRLEEARDITRNRDAVQKTTIRELRAMRFFKQDEVLERYLSAQRMVGVAE